MSSLWKESYKIGVDLIDKQHRELFERVEHFLQEIQNKDVSEHKKFCIDTILFLKNYAIEHFEAEEKYQEEISYRFLDAHKAIHQRFINNVLESESKMLESDFSAASIKDFTGFVTAWLTYHVAGADQKIKTGEVLTIDHAANEDRYTDLFMHSIQNLLTTMFAQENNEIAITKYTKDQNAVNVRIKLMGDFKGEAILSFPQNTVLSFVKSLTEMEFDVIDEMAYSIVSEITNIICGNVATQISSRGLSCDIDPPTLLKGRQELNPKELFCFTTNQGQIAVTLHIAA